jgi:hypothetical protein
LYAEKQEKGSAFLNHILESLMPAVRVEMEKTLSVSASMSRDRFDELLSLSSFDLKDPSSSAWNHSMLPYQPLVVSHMQGIYRNHYQSLLISNFMKPTEKTKTDKRCRGHAQFLLMKKILFSKFAVP